MTRTATRPAAGRTPLEWAALVGGVALAVYLGWDAALWDPRVQLLLHLVGTGAIGLLLVAAIRGDQLPRTRLEVPVLGVLAAYALATATALNHGMSLRAMASVTGFALALPLAIIAIRYRPTWVGLLASLPVLAYAAPTLVALLWRRIEWVVVGAPGLPPLRLPAEGSLFGSVAVPPFVIWPAWALAGLIEDPGWRRPIQWALVCVGVPLTILSGSRSAWLAIGVTLIVAGVPWAWRRRRRLRDVAARPGTAVAVGVAGLAALAVGAALVVPRLTAVTSLLYRVDLWRDTLAAWAADPLTGIGPGFMPFARQAAAADFSFPVRQPHSHNVPLGVLGDAGLIGLAAALVLIGALALTVGPWRAASPHGRALALVLFGLGVGSLFEDLTFLPNFNLLVIGLVAAVLVDAGGVRWRPCPAPRSVAGRAIAIGAVPIVVILGAAAITADAGAIAYRNGQDAAHRQQWDSATAWFAHAESIDPWQPTAPKSLAVVAAAAERPDVARAAARRAVERNPGDAQSWVNLGALCVPGDRPCVEDALGRAVATASHGGPELVAAAALLDAVGLTDRADAAYRRSVLTQVLTAFALSWPRDVALGDASLEAPPGIVTDLNRVAAWWAVDERIRTELLTDPVAQALAAAIEGHQAAARAALARAQSTKPDDPQTWDLAVVLGTHWGDSVDRLVEIAEVVRGRPFPPPDATRPLPGTTLDIASFRGYPLDGLLPGLPRLDAHPAYPWAFREALP